MTDKRLVDREWRLQYFWRIKDKNQSIIKFKKNRAQEHFDKNRAKRNIILKARRLGFTTYEAITMLDKVAFTKNFDALFIAQDLQTASDIYSNKVLFAWKSLHPELRALWTVDTNSARKLKFNLGTKDAPIESSITVDSSGRSGTFRKLHVTEFGPLCKNFPEKAHEIIAGTIPSIPIDGEVDFESTADGSTGHFYEMFWEAWERGEPTLPTQYKAHFYNWTWEDEEIEKITDGQINEFLGSKDYKLFEKYQKDNKFSDDEITFYYFKWVSLNRNWNDLHREYPTTPFEAFASSGNKMFDQQKLGEFQTSEPIKKEGDIWIYKEPQLGHEYAIGADIGEGIGKDSSAFAVWDFTLVKPKVVAIYRNNKIAPDLFAYELRNAGVKYQWATIAPERNNHGHTTISKLREIYPERLIYGFDSTKEKQKLGWQTDLVSKPLMFYDLNTAVNNENIDIPATPIVNEMRKYDKEDNRIKSYDEQTTEHFDLLTATAIGFQLRDYKPIREDDGIVTINIPKEI